MQSLLVHVKQGRFASLADGSHGTVSTKGETHLMCLVGAHLVCFVGTGLLAGEGAGRPGSS